MKLRIKFFLISALIAIIPSAALTIVAYQQYVQAMDNRISAIVSEQFNNMVQAASSTYSTVQRAFHIMTYYEESGDSVVGSLKRTINPNLALTQYEQYEEFNNVRRFCSIVNYAFDDIHGIYVFDASGSLFSYVNSDYFSISEPCIPTEEEWYQNTLELQGDIYICSMDADIITDTPRDVVLFAHSITDYVTRQSIGMVVFEFSPEIFQLDQSNALGDFSLITLKNTDNGDTLYSSYSGESVPFSESQFSDTAMVQSVPDTPLELTLIYDHNSLLREYNQVALYFLAFALLCIIFTLILSYIFSHSLVRPIEALTDQMLHTNAKQLSPTRSDYSNRPDEIGILYRQYFSLLDTLNTYIKEQYQNKLIVLDAQMKSLEARINSHFLFNTLEAINSIAEIEENEEIATMSLALGRMFRYAIKTESELVPLRQELEHVLDYTAIQSIRFNNRFHLSVQVPDELREKRILKLILQPLAENALIHGLNYCVCGDEICIAACLDGANIQITISDNGQGMPEEQLQELGRMLNTEASFTELGHRYKQSIGLKNIHSRIELYYGKGYGLAISSQPNRGTSIQITIPNL